MAGQLPTYQLHILQGRTEFPVRPLVGRRYVIGAGSQCQLQLGGHMPLVHSILTQHADGWEIEALVPYPLMMVNGQSARKIQLAPGDTLELGEFRLLYELAAAVSSPQEIVLPPFPEAAPVPVADALAADPQKLSAARLVERLEVAMEELESLETRRRKGWENLLSAAFSAGEDTEIAPVPEVSIPEPTRWVQLEEALERLTTQVTDLHQRETALLDNARQMESQQQLLLEQIEIIRAELSQQKSVPSHQLKISA